MTATDIKRLALEAGFDLAGISPAALAPRHAEALGRWIADGFAGTMGYMVRDGADRAKPERRLEGARSVISLAVNYYHPDDPKPKQGMGRIAKYAYGRDYHRIIEKMLKRLIRAIRAMEPAARLKGYVDTGPVLEKAFAQSAGLGFFGKNTNLITREYGSYVFLASLLTDLELAADEPHAGSCGSCRLCIDACPTGALLGDHRIDARRCIAYLTIESKEDPPPELESRMGEWAFGCDVCQEVCPYNFRAKLTRHEEIYPKKIAGTWVELERIGRARFPGSPVNRPRPV